MCAILTFYNQQSRKKKVVFFSRDPAEKAGVFHLYHWMVGFRAEVKTCMAGEPAGHLRKIPTLFTNDAPVSSYLHR